MIVPSKSKNAPTCGPDGTDRISATRSDTRPAAAAASATGRLLPVDGVQLGRLRYEGDHLRQLPDERLPTGRQVILARFDQLAVPGQLERTRELFFRHR